ncbi:MAG: spermidine/putrescine ABC transporter substrate-binding protein [Candidatus Cloacimonadota bacterium]|nr:MAG: spermidine/putrescine ABC transporter substrate-binding protein [Candidatus Cloacimonadota bacterium]
MNYFNEKTTLAEIVEKYPDTINVFTSNGFRQMGNAEMRKKFAGNLNLKTALMLKQIDYESFSELLIEAIENKTYANDVTVSSGTQENGDINLVGLLPCPVRIPLLEAFNKFIKSFEKEHNIRVSHELKAASMGLDWIEENIRGTEDADKLPDIFISAGFDTFFDKDLFGKFNEQGLFEDISEQNEYNKLFAPYNMKDPKNNFSLIGVVPAIFLVNTDELGDLKMPETWADLMKHEFKKSVSLPVGDFDLFNGILLNIHKKYGDEGVRKIGESLLESLHPSQMVNSNKKRNNRPIVTIMPYFFTKAVKNGGPMQAVWPKDGAIISPIFMIAKKEKKELIRPIVKFFSSRTVGEILSHQGLFPGVNPDIDNRIPEENTFQWLGWDYIYNNNLSKLIEHCVKVFENSHNESE